MDGWLMENLIKMDDLGVPLFLETPIWISFSIGWFLGSCKTSCCWFPSTLPLNPATVSQQKWYFPMFSSFHVDFPGCIVCLIEKGVVVLRNLSGGGKDSIRCYPSGYGGNKWWTIVLFYCWKRMTQDDQLVNSTRMYAYIKQIYIFIFIFTMYYGPWYCLADKQES